VTKAKCTRPMPPGDESLARLESFLLQNIEDEARLGTLLTLHTGLRLGELCAITWRDIDLEEGLIHVRGNLQRVKTYGIQGKKTQLMLQSPKTLDSARDIPIPPTLIGIFTANKKDPTKPLVGGPRGGWMDPRTMENRFKRMLEECGIGHFNFHMLRHAFASRCMEKGFDIKTLSEILGHSDTRTTSNLYVHPSMRRKKMLMGMLGAYSA